MKRVLILLIATVILLSSCSFGDFNMRKDMFSMNDNKVANESFEKIIVAIQNQDSAALKALFSEKALSEAQNMDDTIDELFDFYQGYILSVDNNGGPYASRERKADGNVIKEIQPTWDVETSEKKYHFAFREFVQDTEFPDNIGIYALYIVETNRLDEPVADWWMKDGVWIPGITIKKK